MRETIIREQRGSNGEGAKIYLSIYGHRYRGQKVCASVVFVCVRECRCVCPKSAAAAAGKEWDLCSKQPAGYLKASGPVLD